jgi:hypothetical protein
MFSDIQNTTELLLGGNSIRAQKTYAIDYCSSAFTTEGSHPIRSTFGRNPDLVSQEKSNIASQNYFPTM